MNVRTEMDMINKDSVVSIFGRLHFISYLVYGSLMPWKGTLSTFLQTSVSQSYANKPLLYMEMSYLLKKQEVMKNIFEM